MLGGDLENALAVMKPILEDNKNNLDILLKTGWIYAELYKRNGDKSNRNGGMSLFNEVIEYYNNKVGTPPPFWDAWLGNLTIMNEEYKANPTPKLKSQITQIGLSLLDHDKRLGGDPYQDKYWKILDEYGVNRPNLDDDPSQDQPETVTAPLLGQQIRKLMGGSGLDF